MESSRGVVHGKVIELDEELGLPDGQRVTVVVQPVGTGTEPPSDSLLGEGLRRAFGAWSDDAEELDEYLHWTRLQRKRGRPGIEP